MFSIHIQFMISISSWDYYLQTSALQVIWNVRNTDFFEGSASCVVKTKTGQSIFSAILLWSSRAALDIETILLQATTVAAANIWRHHGSQIIAAAAAAAPQVCHFLVWAADDILRKNWLCAW